MKIALTHMSDDLNRGDYAILAATHKALKRENGGSVITAVSVELSNQGLADIPETALTRGLGCEVVGTPTPARRHFRGATWRWIAQLAWAEVTLLLAKTLGARMFVLLPRTAHAFITTLRTADLVVAKGGSYLYAKGGAREWLYLWRMLYPIRVAKIVSPRVVLLGVSIGEFESLGSRCLARAAVGDGVEVWVREPCSVRRAREQLQVSEKQLRMLPDLAFLTTRPAAIPSAGIAAGVGTGVTLGVTVRAHTVAMGDPRLAEQYVHATARALQRLLQDGWVATVHFIPQVQEDAPLARRIASLVRRPDAVTVVETQPSLEALLALYGELDVLLGARLHSVILAAVMGVPAVHVVCEHSKGWGTLNLLGVTNLGLPYGGATAELLDEKVKFAIEHRNELSKALCRRVPELRSMIESAVADLFDPGGSKEERQKTISRSP